MSKIWFALRKSLSLLFALVALIGGVFASPVSIKEGNARLVNEWSADLSLGMCMGQGIACDGEYFYCTGAVKILSYNTIVKMDHKTNEIVQISEMCLPAEMMLKGYSHLGDCCVYEDKLYIACEDFGFRHPAVAVYNKKTLEFIEYHLVPDECLGNGRIPWCVVKDDVLYFSQSNDVDEIRMLDINNGYSYIGSIKLDKTLYKVQGGEFYNGKLYIVTNSEKYDKPCFAIDPETGHTETAFVRNTGGLDSEGEGIAVCPLENGGVFHIIDVDSSIYLRSYSFEEN